MYWRVAINQTGVYRQICLGTDPDKIADEQLKIKKDDLENKYRIEFLFTRCKSDINLRNILDDDWMRYFHTSINDLYNQELDKVAAKYGASGTIFGMKGYKFGVQTESNRIEILVNVSEKTYDDFHRAYEGIEGAIKLLYLAEVVYEKTSDPGNLITKWIKKLQLEKEE